MTTKAISSTHKERFLEGEIVKRIKADLLECHFNCEDYRDENSVILTSIDIEGDEYEITVSVRVVPSKIIAVTFNYIDGTPSRYEYAEADIALALAFCKGIANVSFDLQNIMAVDNDGNQIYPA